MYSSKPQRCSKLFVWGVWNRYKCLWSTAGGTGGVKVQAYSLRPLLIHGASYLEMNFNLKSIEDKIRISRHSNRVMTVWTVKKTRYWHYRNEKNLEKFLCKLHIIHVAEISRFMIVNMNLILKRFFNTMDSNLHILI